VLILQDLGRGGSRRPRIDAPVPIVKVAADVIDISIAGIRIRDGIRIPHITPVPTEFDGRRARHGSHCRHDLPKVSGIVQCIRIGIDLPGVPIAVKLVTEPDDDIVLQPQAYNTLSDGRKIGILGSSGSRSQC